MTDNPNSPEKSLSSCNDKSPLQPQPILDPPPKSCEDDLEPNLRRVNERDLGWLQDEPSNKKTGFGASANADPMQTGQIVNTDDGNREVVYRNAHFLRGTVEAIRDLFSNIIVIDEAGRQHAIPIVIRSQEKAVAFMLGENIRKDNQTVVDRLRLPLMAVNQKGMELDMGRYTYHKAVDYLNYLRPDNKPGFTIKEKHDRDTIFGITRGLPYNVSFTLYVWTGYMEDMDQIYQQVVTKFSPFAYIKVRGVWWETIVRLDSIADNVVLEPGDQAIRICKFEFNMTAETYVPQPIVRKKAVLSTKVDLLEGTDETNITEVLARLEEEVKGFTC